MPVAYAAAQSPTSKETALTTAAKPFLYGRCLHGLEDLVADALVSTCGARILDRGHRELLFSWCDPQRIRGLGLLDDLFVYCGEISGLDHTRASLARMGDGVTGVLVKGTRRAMAIRPGAAPRTLRVVASYLGRRNYNRFDIEEAVGDPLARQLGLRRVASSEREADAILRVHLRDGKAIVALRFFPAPLHHRDYRQRHMQAASLPQAARAMAYVAQLEPGMAVLDPYCGTGTILIEAHLHCPGLVARGSDLSLPRLRAGTANAVAAAAPIRWVAASALDLPFPAARFDRLLTNVPWDRQVEHWGEQRRAWEEVRRVVRDDGWIVALLSRAAAPGDLFTIESDLQLRIHGQNAWIAALRPA